MTNFEKLPGSENKEKEQSPEEIRAVLKEALGKEAPVDLVILNSMGQPESVPFLFVEAIEDNHVMMTYLDRDGQLGESIPLELSRVKKAELSEH